MRLTAAGTPLLLSSPRGGAPYRVPIAVLTLMLAAGTQAEIYKWTDSAGQSHYTDRPPAATETEVMQVDTSRDEDNAARLRGLREAAEQRGTARRAVQAEAEGKRAEAEKIAAHCQSAKANLERLLTSTRRQFLNDRGEREFVSEERRQQMIQAARAELDKHCK